MTYNSRRLINFSRVMSSKGVNAEYLRAVIIYGIQILSSRRGSLLVFFLYLTCVVRPTY